MCLRNIWIYRSKTKEIVGGLSRVVVRVAIITNTAKLGIKVMKKILCITLIVMLFLCLFGCGKSKKIEKDLYVLVFEDGPVFDYTYSNYVYNEAGQITEYRRAEDGNSIGTYYLEYDNEGKLISQKRVNDYGYEIVNYVYDSDGYLIRQYSSSDWSNENGKEFTYTYTFNEKGQIATKRSQNINVEDAWLEYSYDYNEDGLVIRERQHSPWSTHIIEYIYDEFGNVIEKHSSVLNNHEERRVTYYTYECIGTYFTDEVSGK